MCDADHFAQSTLKSRITRRTTVALTQFSVSTRTFGGLTFILTFLPSPSGINTFASIDLHLGTVPLLYPSYPCTSVYYTSSNRSHFKELFYNSPTLDNPISFQSLGLPASKGDSKNFMRFVKTGSSVLESESAWLQPAWPARRLPSTWYTILVHCDFHRSPAEPNDGGISKDWVECGFEVCLGFRI
jgi:hypothetical protein